MNFCMFLSPVSSGQPVSPVRGRFCCRGSHMLGQVSPPIRPACPAWVVFTRPRALDRLRAVYKMDWVTTLQAFGEPRIAFFNTSSSSGQFLNPAGPVHLDPSQLWEPCTDSLSVALWTPLEPNVSTASQSSGTVYDSCGSGSPQEFIRVVICWSVVLVVSLPVPGSGLFWEEGCFCLH